MKSIAIGLLAVLAVAVLLSCGGQGPTPRGATPPKPTVAKPAPHAERPIESAVKVDPDPWASFKKRETEVQLAGKKVILDLLKNPDDASFPWFGVDTIFVAPCFHVRGKVQAKNDFGAELTKPFLVSYQCNPKDDSITLKEVDFDGKVVYLNEQLEQEEKNERIAADKTREQGLRKLARDIESNRKEAKEREQQEFAKEHPDEAAQKKFGGVLHNARALIKAQIYTSAEKSLRRIIKEAPGTKVAAEAQKMLDSMPKN